MSKERRTNGDISVHAIAGTEVVLLGLNVTETAAEGLLGFTIQRYDHKFGEKKYLRGGRRFEGTAATDSSTAPIQEFLWGDYEADPGMTYTYIVWPTYGSPDKLVRGQPVEVEITTETLEWASQEVEKNAVFFNRGVAGSQGYSRKFGDHRKFYLTEKFGNKSWQELIKPDDIPDRAAWKWLSRGLEEAMLRFIGQANGPDYAIRAAVYELTYLPVLDAFAAALESGADVRIIHHSKHKTKTEKEAGHEVLDEVGQAAQAAIEQVGLKELKDAQRWLKVGDENLLRDEDGRLVSEVFIERTHTTISHNKFIILLKNDVPIQVWTGSTNLTAGGIFGQSNVGHIIRDEHVAAQYLEYWQQLAADPDHNSLQTWVANQQPDLNGPPPNDSTTPIFSPRPTTAMLQWYADRAGEAKSSIHFTAAFGVSQEIGEKLVEPKSNLQDNPYLSYILLEGKDSPTASEKKKKAAEEQGKPIPVDYYDFIKLPQNRIAYGDVLRDRNTGMDEKDHLKETLTGLNTFVDYLHTKYLLIDPLTDNPTVISGSANFSNNSTVNNDENMLVIQGNTRVADIFLTEFMRLFNHFRIRNDINQMSDEEAERTRYLTANDEWRTLFYEEGSQAFEQRLLFK